MTTPDPTPEGLRPIDLARVRAEASLDGLRAAREVVARQTDLTELVYFDRPSDFRKGVLTCLAALDAAIKEAQP